MEFQLWAVMAVLGVASLYLLVVVVRGWRRVRRGACSSGCGCPSKAATNVIAAKDLAGRLRQRRAV